VVIRRRNCNSGKSERRLDQIVLPGTGNDSPKVSWVCACLCLPLIVTDRCENFDVNIRTRYLRAESYRYDMLILQRYDIAFRR
jgi:hypothetical protein